MIETVSTTSFYSIGGHFLFFFVITTALCLFVDISPLQKYPACKLNYLIASILAAIIPSVLTSSISFSSITEELLLGIGSAVIASIIFILTIQRVIDIEVEF